MRLLPLVLCLSVFAGTIEISFNPDGSFQTLNLPTGDSVTYSRNSDGSLEKAFNNVESITRITHSDLWTVPFLSPTRYPYSLEQILSAYNEVENDEIFKFTVEDFMHDYVSQAFPSSPLSEEIKTDLVQVIHKLQDCAPEAHGLLTRFLNQDKIRFSEAIPNVYAAIVPMFATEEILLSSTWIEGMQTGLWNPLKFVERDPQRSASIDSQLRTDYFGDETVDLARLNNPSRDWKYAFALLHEVGHLVQHSYSHIREAILGFSIPYISYTQRFQGMAMFGAPDPQFVQILDYATERFNLYKTSVEKGATFFALDAIAGCSTNL